MNGMRPGEKSKMIVVIAIVHVAQLISCDTATVKQDNIPAASRLSI